MPTPTARRAFAFGALLFAAACSRDKAAARPRRADPDPATAAYAPALGVSIAQFRKQPSGLYVQDTQPGTGAEATAGRTVRVHYTGWLPDGTRFDTSREEGEPIEFGLGQGQVIRGWDEGISGMKVGGKRKLVIPPALGYGETGAGEDIPPNATLVFDVELVDVR